MGDKRYTLPNLVPNEKYAIQARAIDNGESSVWSRKIVFETISDVTSGGPNGGVITAPETPTLISWTASNAGYTAVWSPITIMADGKPTVVVHYDMELTSSVTGTTHIYKYYTNSKTTISYTIPLGQMKSYFAGQNPGNVTLRVRAVNSADTVSEWSNALTCSMGTPDPPTNAVVQEIIDGLKISWTPPVNKNFLDGYNVYISTSGAGFVMSDVNRVYHGASPNYVFITGNYSLHYIKITSYSDSGTESTFLPATGTPKSPFTLDVVPPTVPVLAGNLSVSSTLPRLAEMSWTFNAATPGNEDIAGFVIAWRKVGATNWFEDYFTPDLRAGTIELPLPYADYEFKIKAYDKVGNYSAYSTPVLSLNGSIPGAPAQVTNVTSTASLDAFNIKWDANTEADVINGGVYNVDIATNTGFSTGLQSYTTGATAISINGLLPNTTYYYRVRAVDVSNTAGIYSTTGSRLTPDYAPTKSDGAAPASSPQASVIQGIGYLTAMWTRITNNDLVTYDVHLSTTSNFTPSAGTLVTSTTATSTIIKTTAAQTPLAYGTSYYVRIVARDADGSAAAGVQGGPVQIQQATNADIADVSFGKITSGSISSGTFTIAPGGSLTTQNGDVVITGSGITVGANSSISAAAMQAGTAFVDDLTIQSNFTINTGGVMKSSAYSPGSSGWQLSKDTFDFRSGTISAGTLVAGTITSSGIAIGAGGEIVVDSTGAIRSNVYSVGVTGWKISSTGIEMNDSNSSISVSSVKTGTIASTTFVVGSGGAIQSSNWNGTTTGFHLSNTGLTMYSGTIRGTAVYTDQIASLATDPNSPLPPLPGLSQGAAFGINAQGKAIFSGANIYGNTIVADSSSHFVMSSRWSPGAAGWIIRGDGYAEFGNLAIYGDAKVRGQLSSWSQDAAGGIGWILHANGTAQLFGGSIELGTNGGGKVLLFNNGSKGTLRFYPPGHGVGSGTFSNITAEGEEMRIRGAFGGAVDLNNWLWTPWGGVNNGVFLAQRIYVPYEAYIGGGMQIGGGVTIGSGVTMNHTLTVNNTTTVYGEINAHSMNLNNGLSLGGGGNLHVQNNWIYGHSMQLPGAFTGDPSMAWMNPGGARLVQVGQSGHISHTSINPANVLQSALKYKEDITDLTYTKEQILSLRAVEYNFKKSVEEPARRIGFIADEVAALGLDMLVTYDDEEIEGFTYTHFGAALLKVAQEQQAEIDDLRSRLENLEA